MNLAPPLFSEDQTPVSMPLLADRQKLSEIINDRDDEGNLILLPEQLWDMNPWGHQMLVVKDMGRWRTTSDGDLVTESGIYAPGRESAKPKATGWVLSCGPLIGTGRPGSVAWCPFPREYLPGTKLMFAAHAGYNIKLLEEDPDFNTRWVLMTDNEPWCHVGTHPAEPIIMENPS